MSPLTDPRSTAAMRALWRKRDRLEWWLAAAIGSWILWVLGCLWWLAS